MFVAGELSVDIRPEFVLISGSLCLHPGLFKEVVFVYILVSFSFHLICCIIMQPSRAHLFYVHRCGIFLGEKLPISILPGLAPALGDCLHLSWQTPCRKHYKATRTSDGVYESHRKGQGHPIYLLVQITVRLGG